MKTIPGTHIPLCLVCEDEAATTTTGGIGPVCAECCVLAIRGQQACLHVGIGPDTIASHARNNRSAKP